MMLDFIRAADVFRRHGLAQYEDVTRMGEDKVWGIMPSPTQYLARDAGIVRYSPLAGECATWAPIARGAGQRDYSIPLEAGRLSPSSEDLYPEKNICDHDRGHDSRNAVGHENLSASVRSRADGSGDRGRAR